MTQPSKRKPDSFWNFMKKKCIDCYNLNKNRKIQKRWNSFYIKLCPIHQENYNQIYLELRTKSMERVR